MCDFVQEGVEEGTVISVIGNKTDLFDADPEHVTKVIDGSKMAVVSIVCNYTFVQRHENCSIL